MVLSELHVSLKSISNPKRKKEKDITSPGFRHLACSQGSSMWHRTKTKEREGNTAVPVCSNQEKGTECSHLTLYLYL